MFSSPNPSLRAAFCSPLSSRNKTIRPVMSMSCKGTDYYTLLSVSDGCHASNEDIKKAYRAKALQYHPDLVCDPSLKDKCTRMFVQLNAAYKTLSDPVLRREYDDSLMGLKGNHHGTSTGFKGDYRDLWQRQILELNRRSNLRRNWSLSSWGGRMRAQNR
ncbi:chaperone protein dnaJ 20, chloroplastic-like [Cucurbita pepo subsp. pepo]|uniref:chaperone protein dnaJ 20, chloroplastic-like n=1 Tax=Cucurbita pepo subsp. pepo TaxID=3664 RepID=UPI000C9D375A|nr:chaperone protein dnaJ 20, chloroplastic-like [Cucurbita pepo subsp. pepo]